jgi:hypothetical protein
LGTARPPPPHRQRYFSELYIYREKLLLPARRVHKLSMSRGILGRNPDKSLKSFPPCYSQSPSTALPRDLYFLKLTKPLTVSRVQLLYTVKEKGGKTDRKPYPLPYGLNLDRNLKSENYEDYAQRNCMFMNSAFQHTLTMCMVVQNIRSRFLFTVIRFVVKLKYAQSKV